MVRHESLDYWLALTLVPGLGALGIARAWRGLGSAAAIIQAPESILQNYGIRPAAACAMASFSDWRRVAAIRSQVAGLGGEIIALDDPRYPEPLARIVDPPSVLYLKGSVACLSLPGIAVVGARQASALGRHFAFSLSSRLASQGLAVVSGLALGVDGAAHEGSLQGGGPTLAVLGTGLDLVYPAVHRHLSARITENGALLTEFPPGTVPNKGNFPRRNRLVSGLACGVVVVEAGERSGSLITARLALEQGREVFAVPGPPGMPGSRGVNRLLKDGAQLLESVDDIFVALPWLLTARQKNHSSGQMRAGSSRPVLNREQACLVAALGQDESTFDELLEKLSWETGLLSRLLLELELSGMLIKGAGGSLRIAPEYL
ncbi:MAG TPA: DNA-protecting protein DprA [Proteobacteria bacterium]|nr:DNA-protecting protein DprA [Pseudomonadota bacterium]